MTRILLRLSIAVLLLTALPGLYAQECLSAKTAAAITGTDAMKVRLEIFLATLVGDTTVRYVVQRHDITHKPRNPDDLVLDLAFGTTPGPVTLSRKRCYIHSTSWRYERDGAIILTYFVYSDRMKFQGDVGSVLRLEDVSITVSEDATRPRPAVLMEEQIVAHGIRHLGYLAKTNNRNLQNVISPESLRRLQAMEGLLAGKFN
jgi:hypothetical protein